MPGDTEPLILFHESALRKKCGIQAYSAQDILKYSSIYRLVMNSIPHIFQAVYLEVYLIFYGRISTHIPLSILSIPSFSNY